MNITTDGNTITLTGTLDQAVQRAEDAYKLGGHHGNKHLASREEYGKTKPWAGTSHFPEAAQLARDGWHEGAKRLADLRDRLAESVGELLPETVYMMDVTGFDVDVGAYLAGEPECMVTTAQMPGASKQIHMAVNVSNSAYVDPEAMIMRGLLAAGVVDALEAMGHRVTLDVIIPTVNRWENTHNNCNIIVQLKQADEVLDVERVAYACAHPSMLRRLSFGIKESLPKEWQQGTGVGGGYGQPVDEVEFTYPDEQPDIYIGNANTASNMEEVLDQVVQYLRDSGALS